MTTPTESPSALLRRAADRLDELAGDATEGPWFAHEQADYDCDFEATVGTGNGQYVDDKTDIIGHGYEGGGAHRLADAAYIAAVDPFAGQAFAVMLRAVADDAEACDRQNARHPDNDGMTRVMYHPMTVAAINAARRILGETS